jgi:acetyl esterase/lipase
MAASEMKIIPYGSHQEQYIRVSTPPRRKPTLALSPTVVIFHGGFWKAKYSLDNSCVETLCPFFLSKCYVVCEVEYRRREHEGGGFPGTNSDCVNALHELKRLSTEENEDLQIDISRVILLGHSAGAYLALWIGCAGSEMRDALPFLPLLIVAIAPVG